MFGEAPEVINTNLPYFVPSELFWGLGLIVVSIVFSILLWHAKGKLNAKGIFIWLLNLLVFIFALMKISAAFPRIPFYVTFIVLFIAVLVLAGGGVVASKKEDTAKAGPDASGDKKK